LKNDTGPGIKSVRSIEYRILVAYRIQFNLSNFKRGGYTGGYHFCKIHSSGIVSVPTLRVCEESNGMEATLLTGSFVGRIN